MLLKNSKIDSINANRTDYRVQIVSDNHRLLIYDYCGAGYTYGSRANKLSANSIMISGASAGK